MDSLFFCKGEADVFFKDARKIPARIEIYQSADTMRWQKIKYWSNACGELHHRGEYDITEMDLPAPLRIAFNEAYGHGAFMNYLVETDEGFGISSEISIDKSYAKHLGVSFEEVFETLVSTTLEVARHAELNGCTIYLFENIEGIHEAVFVFPPDIDAESMEAAAVIIKQLDDELLYTLEHKDWKKYFYPLKALVCDEAGVRDETEFAHTLCDFGIDAKMMKELGVGDLADYLE